MKIRNIFIILVTIVFISACSERNKIHIVKSPSGETEISFRLEEDGTPLYLIRFKGETIIDWSKMGFELNNKNLLNDFKVVNIYIDSFNEIWEMPWGEQKEVVNHYNEFVIYLQEKSEPYRLLNIYFRAYDDGMAFRYEFPEQENLEEIIITDENTQFKLTEDYTCWWIPGDWDIYEHLYHTTKFSEIDALVARDNGLAQSYIPENAVNTPITMRSASGLHLSFHEANLTDYAGMTLQVDTLNLSMKTELVGSDRLGYKVKCELPFVTPWRTIQIAEKATDLIESKLIVNLNESNKIKDVSWIKPMKYIGIWWEMHLNKSSWDITSGKHGATTENAMAYIDFAAENNIGGVLIEGWNIGWEHWIGFEDREGVFDFVTPYPDYDLKKVANYAKEKGVEIIMHHETSAAPRTYEQQIDTAYKLMNSLGIKAVKTGYVGKIIPKGEYHHGQWMVNHYRKVIEKGAEMGIAINAHEPIKATGLRRTYPNAIAREGLRGQEFNAWSADGGNPPEHLSIIAFTRMLAGPIDFTPGVFNIKLDPYRKDNQVNTTLAHQLALYVVIYSPLQMACDLIENYKDQPAFQFIRDVGVDWEKTIVLNGEVGDYVTIARKEKETENWFLGSITDENERKITVDFSFLDTGKTYEARIYQDGKNAHWKDNPTSIAIETIKVNNSAVIDFNLSSGGGLAISLKL